MITATARYGDGNINSEDSRIIFIHNTAMWYRRPFFNILSQKYDIKFIFTHLDVSKEVYDVEISDKIEGMENVDYVILKNYLNIAFGVINESLGDYDIIIGGSWDSLSEIIETTFFFTIAKIRRKKFILWTEDWNWKIKSTKRKILKHFAKIIIKNSDAILVPGTKQKECVIHLGSKPEKVFLMPNASNFSQKKNLNEENLHLNEENLSDTYSSLKDKRIILFVGRLVKQKGVDYLLTAFAKLKKEMDDIVLLVIGKGDYEKELITITHDLQIDKDVYFLGHLDNEALKTYYKDSALCVAPSITYKMVDAWAFVVNEAMYYENPVIASDAIGSAFDMIQNGVNGFIVPEKDSDALYISMKTILSDEEKREEMGKNSKKIVESSFSYKNMVEGFNNAVKYVKNL
jgi:glycosyltransferase involved in cell wall biosynthesis